MMRSLRRLNSIAPRSGGRIAERRRSFGPVRHCLRLNPDHGDINMRAFTCGIALAITFVIPASSQTRIDAISTTFRWIGPNDKIVVERYDDPQVSNVSCYMSRADTGGIKGGLGFAEDPSRFSIACRAVGPVAIPLGLKKSEVIGFSSASLFFKSFRIHRAVDTEKNVLVYTVVSTKLINGSPFNSISVVPAGIQ
jgi:CreA protein